MNRREFLQLFLAGYMSGMFKKSFANAPINYSPKPFGNVRLIHITDTHAQLNPIYFREPNINLGVGVNKNAPPHIVGNNFLKYYGINEEILKHAYTYLNFNKNAHNFGKFGGFAYLKTVIDELRSNVNNNALLLDGGDTWQGSGLSLLENGNDMVKASNILGVDIMTGHWEFTFGENQFLKNLKKFSGDFVAQNIMLNEEAIFSGMEPIDDESHFQKPYIIKVINGNKIAVIGQAFPYTPIANPRRFVPNLTFGIKENELQSLILKIKNKEKPSLVVLLSHNGLDVDKKLAKRVSGIDIILGGHTHDPVPLPIIVDNKNSSTLVINSGCNGKFVSVLDLKIKKSSFDYNYKLLPILSNRIRPSQKMNEVINSLEKPHFNLLNEEIGESNVDLYRRGNFNGTFDNLLCDSMLEVLDSGICLSPGFRWGPTVLAGEKIKMKDIFNQTAITYPNVYSRYMTGETIKNILEDVADNIFNPDPYLQQGGDMVRTKGLSYTITPRKKIGYRISNIFTSNGKRLQASKKYKVSGWASVNSKESGKPIWEVTKEYLKSIKYYDANTKNIPKINFENDNLGIET